jgi:integrase
VTSYLDAAPRSRSTKDRVLRLLLAIGKKELREINQAEVIRLKKNLLRPDPTPATYARSIIVPLRAILRHAYRLGWCDPPIFELPRRTPGRTRYLLPLEAERLIASAAPHLQPLLLFLIGTGARLSEAIELDWRDVDLVGSRAIFWRTKNGTRRVAHLPPRLVAALARLPHREGAVFRWRTTASPSGRTTPRETTYVDRGRETGGHIKTAWRGAIRRSGLDPELTPHDLRHSWASWHYALHRDLLALKVAGGWSSVELVERYAHLLPAGHQDEIRHFLGDEAVTDPAPRLASA